MMFRFLRGDAVVCFYAANRIVRGTVIEQYSQGVEVRTPTGLILTLLPENLRLGRIRVFGDVDTTRQWLPTRQQLWPVGEAG